MGPPEPIQSPPPVTSLSPRRSEAQNQKTPLHRPSPVWGEKRERRRLRQKYVDAPPGPTPLGTWSALHPTCLHPPMAMLRNQLPLGRMGISMTGGSLFAMLSAVGSAWLVAGSANRPDALLQRRTVRPHRPTSLVPQDARHELQSAEARHAATTTRPSAFRSGRVPMQRSRAQTVTGPLEQKH